MIMLAAMPLGYATALRTHLELVYAIRVHLSVLVKCIKTGFLLGIFKRA